MADQPLAEMEHRLAAGREYLAALQKLGFQPDAAAWATVGADRRRFELLIVTSWVDAVGPLPIYDLLFEAFDNRATPAEIDPFNVSLFSPHSYLAHALEAFMSAEGVPSDHQARSSGQGLEVDDYRLRRDWILFHGRVESLRQDDLRRFAAFKTKVARLAA